MVTLKGSAANAVWGVPGDVCSGRVVSCNKKNDGEMEPLLTSLGETDGLVLLDERDELAAEVIYDSSFTLPSRGDAFTIANVTGVVLNSEVMWERRGFRKARVNATDWKAMTV
jgi:hypothetical protein